MAAEECQEDLSSNPGAEIVLYVEEGSQIEVEELIRDAINQSLASGHISQEDIQDAVCAGSGISLQHIQDLALEGISHQAITGDKTSWTLSGDSNASDSDQQNDKDDLENDFKCESNDSPTNFQQDSCQEQGETSTGLDDYVENSSSASDKHVTEKIKLETQSSHINRFKVDQHSPEFQSDVQVQVEAGKRRLYLIFLLFNIYITIGLNSQPYAWLVLCIYLSTVKPMLNKEVHTYIQVPT